MIYIILYVIIVAASIYITYRYFMVLSKPGGDSVMNYALTILFTFFSYINLRRLIRMIKTYKK